MTISTTDFFNLAEVQAQLNIQKTNPFGSNEHYSAHAEILKIAESHGVSQHFESLLDYNNG